MIGYKRGEIVGTTVDGSDGEERLPEVLAWTDGSYEILLPAPSPARRAQARGAGYSASGRPSQARVQAPHHLTHGASAATASGASPFPDPAGARGRRAFRAGQGGHRSVASGPGYRGARGLAALGAAARAAVFAAAVRAPSAASQGSRRPGARPACAHPRPRSRGDNGRLPARDDEARNPRRPRRPRLAHRVRGSNAASAAHGFAYAGQDRGAKRRQDRRSPPARQPCPDKRRRLLLRPTWPNQPCPPRHDRPRPASPSSRRRRSLPPRPRCSQPRCLPRPNQIAAQPRRWRGRSRRPLRRPGRGGRRPCHRRHPLFRSGNRRLRSLLYMWRASQCRRHRPRPPSAPAAPPAELQPAATARPSKPAAPTSNDLLTSLGDHRSETEAVGSSPARGGPHRGGAGDSGAPDASGSRGHSQPASGTPACPGVGAQAIAASDRCASTSSWAWPSALES